MKTFFSIILIFIVMTSYSQVNEHYDDIIDPIEQMPIYPGGDDSLWCFLETNFNYKILNAPHDHAKYVIKFYIDTLGHSTGIELITTIPNKVQIDSLVKNEIFRVFNLMSNWEPASQMGKKVKVGFYIPIPIPYMHFRCKRLKNSP